MPGCSVAKSYLTLCDPVDCSPPGSSVHGISQARTLEWVTFKKSKNFMLIDFSMKCSCHGHVCPI